MLFENIIEHLGSDGATDGILRVNLEVSTRLLQLLQLSDSDLQVVNNDEENYEAESDRIDDGGHLVAQLVRRQILGNHLTHR